MTEAEETLVLQVRSWLEEKMMVEPDKHQAYRHFIGQCERLNIAEDYFYDDILRVAYMGANFKLNDDELDLPNDKLTHVILFGKKIHRLKKLGRVLFNNVQHAGAYFEDASLLKNHVDTLTSADEALHYAMLYKAESNEEKRFLKIVYHLNPGLPFRLDDKQFATLDELFAFAFSNRDSMNQLYNVYAQGQLQIWLNEAYPEEALRARSSKSYQSFLRFIYSVDKNYPFYVKDKLVANPQELANQAMQNLAFRKDVYDLVQNEYLFTWFDSIGHTDWQLRYQAAATQLKEWKLKDENLMQALIQKLCMIILPELPAPLLEASQTSITNLALEAGKVLTLPVGLELIGAGYVNCRIAFDFTIEGIKTDTWEITFFDLNGNTHSGFNLIINPVKLVKNKTYTLSIVITTDYEKLVIPMQVKAVFPKKEYQRYLVKYAVMGTVFAGLLRLLAQLLADDNNYLDPVLIVNNLDYALPSNYIGYLLLFLTVPVALFLSLSLIKKYEKI